jgi:hypothetical protein
MAMTPSPDWLTLPFWTKDSASVRDLVLVLGSVVGGALLIWRTMNYDRQAKAAKSQAVTAEQGRITDRINKAVENLSAQRTVQRENSDLVEPNIEVRLGAIYALERIAQDSERDHIPIMETLCAYIRENAPSSGAVNTDYIKQHVNKILFDRRLLLESSDPNLSVEHWRKLARQEDVYHHVGPPQSPRADIQAAVTVIARRSRNRIEYERRQTQSDDADDLGYCLDLRWTNLQGANLFRARLSRAKLSHSCLDGADLDSAELEQASLVQTSLCKATLRNANLARAYLGMTRFEGAHLALARFDHAYVGQANFERSTLWRAAFDFADCRGTNFRTADFAEASLHGASIESADLSDAERITMTQVESAFGNIDTKLPSYWKTANFPHWAQKKMQGEEFDARYREWLNRVD